MLVFILFSQKFTRLHTKKHIFFFFGFNLNSINAVLKCYRGFVVVTFVV